MFISSHSGFHLSDTVHSSRQKVISSGSLGLFHDMPVQLWVIPEVETDAGGETRCNAYPSRRLKKKKQCSGYALRYSFFQCHCVHVDSLKRTLACMSVRQKWLYVTIFKPCVLHRHSHMCGQPVCFSVTLLHAHMHSSSLYRLQRFIGRSQWRRTPCLCVRVRVWQHLSNWWCFEMFSMPFSTGLCQRRRGEFCLHCLYRKKNKLGITTFLFHKL